MNEIEDAMSKFAQKPVKKVRLGDICKRQSGINITARQMSQINTPGGPVRVFAGGNTIADVGFSDIPKERIITVPSIIVKSRGNIGFSFYEKPFTHKNEMWSYSSVSNQVDLKYVYYCLDKDSGYFQKKAKTGKLPQISVGDTDDYMIPLPPLEAQREIVRILDSFTLLTAELTAELTARNSQFDYYRNYLLDFSEATTPFVKLKDLFFTRNGYTPSKRIASYWENGTIPWFRMEDIRTNGHILRRAIQSVSASALKKGKIFPANSIIVSTSATIGEHALITVPSLTNQRFTCLSLKEKYKESFDIEFLYYYCYKLDAYCLSTLNKGNFASVDMSRFGEFLFPMPSLAEQRKRVEILKKMDSLRSDISYGLPAEIEGRKKQYEYYRNSLLSFPELKE